MRDIGEIGMSFTPLEDPVFGCRNPDAWHRDHGPACVSASSQAQDAIREIEDDDKSFAGMGRMQAEYY